MPSPDAMLVDFPQLHDSWCFRHIELSSGIIPQVALALAIPARSGMESMHPVQAFSSWKLLAKPVHPHSQGLPAIVQTNESTHFTDPDFDKHIQPTRRQGRTHK